MKLLRGRGRWRIAVADDETIIYCPDCQGYHLIKCDVPLNKQLPGHTWDGDELRLNLDDDWLDEQDDTALCHICGCYPCEHTHGM